MNIKSICIIYKYKEKINLTRDQAVYILINVCSSSIFINSVQSIFQYIYSNSAISPHDIDKINSGRYHINRRNNK